MAGFIAFEQLRQGKIQASEAKANAEFNAKVARNEAARKEEAGRLEADRIRREKIKLTKSQRVGFGKSGVTSEGTPIDVMIKSAAEEELNAQISQFNAGVSAAQSRTEADLLIFKGKQRARAIKSSSRIQAGSTLLSAAAQAGSGGA